MSQRAKETDSKKYFATFFKVILGLLFLGLGAWAILKWWSLLFMIIKGCLGPLLLLAGIITLIIAKE